MLPGTSAGDRAPGQTQSLYRKYRPTTFENDELVGQEHVSRTLRNAISRDRVAHAYLFCGPRGTGKTSTARLLAKAVNCLDPDPEQRPCNVCANCTAINQSRTTDIIEIDAASNRGIDDIRDLREQVKYAPSQLRTKFYIIDEAHQITKDAFNAFLKTLEEPPPNTTFVLATTDPDKLPETIASRCQRFDFQRIPHDQMVQRVRSVCEREEITIDDDALEIVVRRATGSLRDALSLIDMLATSAGAQSDGRIDVDLARRMLGISDDGWEYDLARALADRDVAAGLKTIAQAVDAGQDMRSFGRRVLDLLRLLMLVRAGADPVEANERIRDLAGRFDLPQLLYINRQFSDVDFKIRNAGFPQLPLELAFVGSLVQQSGGAVVAPAPSYAPARQPESRPAAQPGTPVIEETSRRSPEPARRESPPAPQWSAPPAPASRPVEPAPSRRDQRPQTAARATPPTAAPASLQAVISNWERIRTEVKAADRKAEALLASTDPARVIGDELYVVAAYPFHAGKLNESRVRAIVEAAIERVTGSRLRTSFVIKDDLPDSDRSGAPIPVTGSPGGGNGRAATAAPPASESNGLHEDAPVFDDEPPPAADDERLRHAKVIFDAEELDPDEEAALGISKA